MASFTRRTHIVRISDAKAGDPPSDTYVDVEVLDAISFRGPDGKEMILNMPPDKIVPAIRDDTGGKNGKVPNKPTRLSHMERIIGDDPTQKLDVEIIDVAAFRDANGQEWILNMTSTNGQPSVFDTTDGTGDRRATRRTHTEKVSDFTTKNPTSFVTVERCDAMAFRTITGREMIIKCPSNDDPLSSASRASTVTTPQGYDPTKPDGPIPPPNKDGDVYVAFVQGASGFMTGTKKISQGPYWWIRKVNSSGPIVFVRVDYSVSSSLSALGTPDIQLIEMPYSGKWSIFGDIKEPIKVGGKLPPIVNPVTGGMLSSYYQWTPAPAVEVSKVLNFAPTTIYYVTDGSVEITPENYNLTYPFATNQCGDHIAYIGAAGGTFTDCNGEYLFQLSQLGIDPLPQQGTGGVFRTREAAEYYASAFNIWSNARGFGLTLTVGEIQVASGTRTFTKSGTAVFELNVTAIKNKLIATLGTRAVAPTKITFTISIPASPTGTVNIAAQGYKSLRDFKLDDKNVPKFTPWEPQAQISPAFNLDTFNVIGSIDLKTLEITFESDNTPPRLG